MASEASAPAGALGPRAAARSLKAKRIMSFEPGKYSIVRKLEPALYQLHKWFINERAHDNEVRRRSIATRLLYIMEQERDKQLVLEQHGNTEFNQDYLVALQDKLSWFTIASSSKRQDLWFERVINPRIGATARVGQHLSEKDSSLDKVKAEVTWATIDRGIWLASYGSAEDLYQFVCDAED